MISFLANPCVIQNTNILKIAASLLKVNSENLCKALVLKTREIAKNVIDSPMNVADCKNSRYKFHLLK